LATLSFRKRETMKRQTAAFRKTARRGEARGFALILSG
jgi:hypothetical protein